MARLASRSSLAALALAALAACADPSTAPTARSLTPGAATLSASSNGLAQRLLHAKVCPGAASGDARCHALVRVDEAAQPLATGAPSGYGPTDLRAAYNLAAAATNNGATQTIAIVDAYDDGNAESDLAVYRSTYGLPPCTTANGCFRKVDQNGGTNYPRGDVGWAEEISLDLDMASAICPKCKILLVEAKTNAFTNLAAAVDRAAAMGATVISNSYGGSEFSSETSSTYESHYNHPGVAVTVSSGDNGYGAEFPASSRYVVAVGGTHLTRAGTARGWAETAWDGAGSGCSAYVPKPSWQTDAGCARRTVADVAAVADPNTGVAVYDTFRLHPGGWLVFGGTSVSAPIIAAVYALAGNAGSSSYPASLLYAHRSSLYDVTSGSNGSCGGSYLCTAVSGFDGPTGLGTPNGTGAF
jgi:subtilase family serine protease